MNKPALRPLAAALLVALPLAIPATANAQSWMARVRAINISPDVSSSIPGLDVKDQRHEVTLNGNSIGKVSVLPPTITVQYHFTDLGAWKPYVGGGINFTYFYNVGLTSPLDLADDWSVGGALQAGLDYEIQKNVYLNLDVKYAWIKNDVTAAGATIGDLKINPWVFGLGVGWRF